ncbi:Type I restriction modification DNA specificity domain protein [Mariniflexile rhizosphaerae]|uniref:restriction endonuclease subunit S n=1 Tax=unclassified Mariniflexile TaxID=2643887 RepID=UPI000E33622F|nr:restriction endonuclease subunit S [Mariniflexile sp. TRM1-10]AXP82223.1 Type I restriction modification DNA specificity domain protein [Mariniflexile sp. TRM1-10]
MKLNYKPIGNFIQRVEHRNRDLKVTRLLGLSMTKEFRETTSNVVGTNMSVYRVMSKYQFACDFMSPIRVNKLPVVLKLDDEPNLVSPAYPVFEVKDRNELDPEYLMMWLRRSEFDRYATFKCDAAIRGGYDWEELCETLIPVPHIDKQREIVKEYNTIQNRIKLNEQLIQKLEETAQAIYREWFVEGNWVNVEIKDFGNVVTGKTPSSNNPEDFGNEMPFVTPGDFKNYNKFVLGAERNLSEEGYSKLKNKILPKGSVIVTCIGSDMGKIAVVKNDCITNQQMNSIIVKETFYTDFLYYYLNFVADEIKGIAMGGSTMPMLSKSDFEKIEVMKPEDDILMKFESVMKPMNKLSITYSKENQKLLELKELLLSKLASVEN